MQGGESRGKRTCDISTFSRELIPNRALVTAGSEDLPTHKYMSTPLSSKKIPLLVSLSTLRLATFGSKILFRPAVLAVPLLPSAGSPAVESMS